MVGFEDYEYAITATQVLFRFVEPAEFLPHDTADAHLDELMAELAKRQPR